MSNRLANETSPYLLQHAANPVDWYPWSEEALEKAKAEDKPIFLSIGYSACHWCHVMAHESFEDADTAATMNAHFVNVKVDREERPTLPLDMKPGSAETGRDALRRHCTRNPSRGLWIQDGHRWGVQREDGMVSSQ
jgi:hypothetical protein